MKVRTPILAALSFAALALGARAFDDEVPPVPPDEEAACEDECVCVAKLPSVTHQATCQIQLYWAGPPNRPDRYDGCCAAGNCKAADEDDCDWVGTFTAVNTAPGIQHINMLIGPGTGGLCFNLAPGDTCAHTISFVDDVEAPCGDSFDFHFEVYDAVGNLCQVPVSMICGTCDEN